MSKHAITFDPDENRTEQQHKKDTNINYIMAKYQKTGVIDHVKKYGGQYMDVPAIDYREAMTLVAEANSMFEELPSLARKKFQNDPEVFLEYVQDPNNKESLREMGLLNPETEEKEPKTTAEEKATEPSKKGSKATSNTEGDSDAKASK